MSENEHSTPRSGLSPKQLIEAVRGVLSAVKNGAGPVAVVVNNNQPGTQHVIETAAGVTLDVGTALYATPSEKEANLNGRNFYELCQRYRHSKDGTGMPGPAECFEDIKKYIRTGELPFPAYEELW
jgi:hypothetical protein